MNRDIVKYEKGSIQKIEDILSIDDYLLGERSDFINRKNNGIILSTNNPIPFRRKKKWGFSSENKNVIIDCVFVARFSA
jgi:hypothetical protein